MSLTKELANLVPGSSFAMAVSTRVDEPPGGPAKAAFAGNVEVFIGGKDDVGPSGFHILAELLPTVEPNKPERLPCF